MSESLPAPNSTLPVIRETQRWLSVCKPGGLATQAPSGIDSLEFRIRRYLARNQPKPDKVYLGVPHRLDRPTSGAMVFAKDKQTARFLAEQFQRRDVGKIYWALVSGKVDSDQGTWKDWMRKIPDEARSEICMEGDPGSQHALLSFRLRYRSDHWNLLEFQLETGRSHQIRVQAASRGCSILGDELYGSTIPFGPLRTDSRQSCIALHARSLEFNDPATRQRVNLTADLPDYWPDIV